MKIRTYIFVFLVLFLAANIAAAKEREDSASSREYKVKAAIIYNFVKFTLVGWPEDAEKNNDKSIVIGIIGKDPFGNAFESIKNEDVGGKKVIIRPLEGFNSPGKGKDKDNEDKSKSPVDAEALRKCHIIFVSSSEKDHTKEIIDLVGDHNVLTIGETKNFLETGGIINFVTDGKRVNFEVNTTAAKRAKLRIGSTILRIATRVVKEETAKK